MAVKPLSSVGRGIRRLDGTTTVAAHHRPRGTVARSATTRRGTLAQVTSLKKFPAQASTLPSITFMSALGAKSHGRLTIERTRQRAIAVSQIRPSQRPHTTDSSNANRFSMSNCISSASSLVNAASLYMAALSNLSLWYRAEKRFLCCSLIILSSHQRYTP